MTADNSLNLCCRLFAATLCLIPCLGLSQNPFPEGKARETVFSVCTQCHSLARITEGELSADEWEFTLYDMVARGAPVHKEDLDLVRRYLVDNFATDSQ